VIIGVKESKSSAKHNNTKNTEEKNENEKEKDNHNNNNEDGWKVFDALIPWEYIQARTMLLLLIRC